LNYYGEGLSSVFDSGVPSDRIFAEWWVRSPHVEATLKGTRAGVASDSSSVIIPEDINAARSRSVEEHLKWRMRVREDFQRETASGRIARGFERDPVSA